MEVAYVQEFGCVCMRVVCACMSPSVYSQNNLSNKFYLGNPYIMTIVTGFGKTVLNRTFCISRNINLKY